MKEQEYIYYCGKSDTSLPDNLFLERNYSLKAWRPKINEMTPKNLFYSSFFAWAIFYFLKIFYRPEYKIFLIYYKKKEIASYCAVLPKYFKTPFMENNDLQIGPIGTRENHQRKGIALYLISKIIESYKDKKINFWYVARKENEPSIKLIEKIGFTKYGEGTKKKRFIGGFLDTFVIDKKF